MTILVLCVVITLGMLGDVVEMRIVNVYDEEEDEEESEDEEQVTK